MTEETILKESNDSTTINPLKTDGFSVLTNVFSLEEVNTARRIILDNKKCLKNTRPNRSSGHLAGFHRYPVFEPLHVMLSNNTKIMEFLKYNLDCAPIVTIGLSDITVNRSQNWHRDLLRGNFRQYIDDKVCWGSDGGGVYKALLYLQDGKSLKVQPGSHLKPIELDDDTFSEPQSRDTVLSIEVKAGDVIIMDIRLSHRGSTEEETQQIATGAEPKVLLSTVFGCKNKELTHAMEIGNFYRLMDWDERHS